MSEMKLTDEQVNAIASAVVVKLEPKPAEPDVEPAPGSNEVVYTDECVKAADEEEMALIKCLPRGTVVYKGRGSSQMVNHTEESMNFLNDWRRNRKSWRTRVNVR
tara:strand:- start:22 stop:336 length:315 start_codon:yes stop_codon:yes gene_type:complete